MKRLILILMVVSLLALGGQAFAELCTIDAVPAATLLLPYFEVDLDANNGVTTLFSINNASAAPALAHVTLWTNWTVPTVDFDVFLTGFDVVTVNLRDVIQDGNIPITADEQSDPSDTISPSIWGQDGSFTNCQNFFPFFVNPLITGSILDRVQNGHTGQFVNAVGGCMGEDLGDNIARGYVTVDNVTQCSTDFPNDPFYFQGIASNVNQLWGDWFLVDPANDFASGDTLVHVEADDNFDATSTPTNYTFYGRYTQILGGIDNREPLGTTWGVRYLNGGVFDGGTDLTVWRDSTANQTQEAYTCGAGAGAGPDWNPLNETQVVAFDEAEDCVEICFSSGGGVISPPTGPDDPACFPLETQKIAFGEGNLTVPFDFGWVYLNLNIPNDTISNDVDFPAAPPGNIAQSHVAATHDASGRFSIGLNAIELTNACQNLDPVIVGAPQN